MKVSFIPLSRLTDNVMPTEYRIYKSQGIVGMSGSSTLVHTTAILSDWRRWPCT
ncbi:MAG: hypothetical protein SOX54_07655 [Prevotella sp.]|nr:hypothetical protein [Prevotella sp.]MDY3272183.1 hypothetical protein [Prevotella sp.]